MNLKLYAPSRHTDGKLVLQIENEQGTEFLGVKEGDEIVYLDRAGTVPGSELERVTGYVAQKIVRLDYNPAEVIIVLRPIEEPINLGQLERVDAQSLPEAKPRCFHSWKNGDRCILDRGHKGVHAR